MTRGKKISNRQEPTLLARVLRAIAFSLMGVIVLLLIAASIVEQFKGTDFVVRYFYTAPWTIALWAMAAVSGIWYMLTQRVFKNVVTCLLHFSFVVILTGAMVTHLFGESGTVHLRLSDPQSSVSPGNENNASQAEVEGIDLPFDIVLKDFVVEYYPGTRAAMDYCSEVQIVGTDVVGKVSMNNVFKYTPKRGSVERLSQRGSYRFYQSAFDSDGMGTTLRVSHDPWGIMVTYIGYLMLLLSMLGFFYQRRTHFRALLHSPLLRMGMVAMLLTMSVSTHAASKSTPKPPTIPKDVAHEFCNLYVYYNDRVCPLQTLAKDFTVKLCGKTSYRGMNAEEVFCGWLFYYDQWAKEPMIKQKGKEVRQLLGGKYVSLNDYVEKGEYKLDELLRSQDKNARAADEKFRLVSMVCTGTMMLIYPLSPAEGEPIGWYSWVSQLPPQTTADDFRFVKGSMEYVWLSVAKRDQKNAIDALQKIRQWQEQKAGEANLPSVARFRSEKIYNNMHYTKPLAMACTLIGIVLYLIVCIYMSRGRRIGKRWSYGLAAALLCVWIVLTVALILRWVVSGHIPLSNGFETMQFLSWIAALVAVVVGYDGKRQLALPIGYLLTGLTLMVSMMSASNPQVTNLMPVLQSPLLSLHVAIIMVAYCLLFFVMMNGVTAVGLRCFSRQPKRRMKAQVKRLQVVSQLLLYPAVFCLTIGIFIGAVWANQSWGRYWGWDPKEVWALITMLLYSLLFHTKSLRWLRRPMVFHIYTIIAFLAVLFTYFGVNFLLGGMHAYAQ